jgi:hypothetical protein
MSVGTIGWTFVEGGLNAGNGLVVGEAFEWSASRTLPAGECWSLAKASASFFSNCQRTLKGFLHEEVCLSKKKLKKLELYLEMYFYLLLSTAFLAG